MATQAHIAPQQQGPSVGVIGAGSFGTTIAQLIAANAPVLLYSRRPEVVADINRTRQHMGVALSANIRATERIEDLAQQCRVIFPIVPSAGFRAMMREIGPHLRPYHILIHGTKGFDTGDLDLNMATPRQISRSDVRTMSEVIMEESEVLRVGCLSGPNLHSEILEGQPAATVIGSRYSEVTKLGKKLLRGQHFQVFGTKDLMGAELAGALKNIIAIGAGLLGGVGLGRNIWALLVTRGLSEMIHIGRAMGADPKAFLGVAGIGDLVATASSENSRNYTFGKRLAEGDSFANIQQSMPELAEGVRTLLIAKGLADDFKLHAPITQALYRVVYEGFDLQKAIHYLMTYPYSEDVDFM